MTFSIKDFFSKCDQIRSFQFPADLVTFTEEILNVKLNFLCSETETLTTSRTHFKGTNMMCHLKVS